MSENAKTLAEEAKRLVDRHVGVVRRHINGEVTLMDCERSWGDVMDAIDRLASKVEALEAGWQPIETAPKDGRKLMLAYINRAGKARTVLACWLTDEEAAESDADGFGLEGGWYECIDNWNDYCQVAIHEGEPTHWMPLPAAPQANASREEGGK